MENGARVTRALHSERNTTCSDVHSGCFAFRDRRGSLGLAERLQTPTAMSLRRRRSRWARGAVLPEYALVVLFVAVPTLIGFAIGGYRMLENYRGVRANIVKTGP